VVQYAAGWYPQEDGRQRYYDGNQWTDHFHGPQDVATSSATTTTRSYGALSDAVGRLTERHAGPTSDEVIWSAVGKAMTGIVNGRFWLTASYLFFERGLLSTDSQQVPISAVVDVDVHQSMGQKARGVFSVIVHIQRPHRVELVAMNDIHDGREAQRIINATAHGARHAIRTAENTQTVRYQGMAPTAGPQEAQKPVTAEARTAEPMTMLRQLAELRDAGVLSVEEFEVKKREILARI
jgi:hypothetical protein